MKPSRSILVVEVLHDSLYDESGVVCYQYGNMGEVTQETRIYALPFLSSPVALSTQFTYDSWGRIQDITYPDNEVVSYTYDLGGQLQSLANTSNYKYLDSVKYDRFGSKTSQKYGNGLKTNYTYNNVTRRLSTITTLNGNSQISTYAYTYDPVGNVTQVTSTNPWLPSLSFSETFTYDASDQLTAATEQQHYQLSVTYGNWGKVNTYDLTHTDLLQNITTQNAYTLTYPTDPDNPQDAQTNFAPTMQLSGTGGTQTVMTQYTFGINGSLRKKEHIGGQQPVEYFLFNSASNLKAYSYDKTDFAYYGYNAANTRTYKLSCSGTAQWRNGILIRMNMQLQQAMFYPNAYINFNHNGEYTKHYYNGSERIASRLGTATPSISTTANGRLIARTNRVGSRFQAEVKELIYETAQVNPPMAMSITSLQSTNNMDIFYYHTNHLGSTAFVTDQNRNVTQGFLYAPFGEITTEYNATFGNDIIPKYSFNAKELDEETGMYYYEARYYKPPVFTSRDPMMDQKPWLTPYHYCSNNPVGRVDPSGMLDDWYEDANGCILWTDCRSQKEMYENEIYGRYLGQAHIVFTGSRWEKGGPKNGKGNYIDGDGACNANVTVYGPKNANDIHYFTGYTMTSNAEKFIPIDEGLYDGVLGDKGGVLPSIWALKGNIRTIDGVPNTNPESKGDWNYNTSWKTGIFIHSTGSGGNLGTRNSTGCLLILDSEWSEFNKVLSNVTSFSVRVQRYTYGYIPLEGVNGPIPNVFVPGLFLKKQ